MRSCILLILVEKKVLFNVYSFFGIQSLPFFFFFFDRLFHVIFACLGFHGHLKFGSGTVQCLQGCQCQCSGYSLKCAISENLILMLSRVVQFYFIPLFLKSLYLLNYRLFPSSWHHFSWCFKERQYIIYMFLLCIYIYIFNVKYFSLATEFRK